jgi:pilus assembly protein CpaE
VADQPKLVLVVSRQASRSETISKALDKRGLRMLAFENSAAAAGGVRESGAEAVLIEVTDDDPDLVPLIQLIRSGGDRPAMPVLLVVADPEAPLVAAATEAGASTVLPRSSSTQAVAETLRAMLAEDAAAPGAAATPATPASKSRKGAGELWVVCGPRGGVGRTALASNLAVIAAETLRVALVDNVPRFGSALMAFNLPPQTPTWVELADLPGDEDLLDRLTRHPSGVSVLPAPGRPELSDSVAPAAVGALIFRLTGLADLVVVDQGGRLDNGGIDLLESCDHMILVGTPDNPGVVGLRGWLRICDQLQIPRERISVVLNCVLPYHQVDAERAKRVLEQPVLALPHGGIDGVRSLSGGEPLAWKHPSNRWVKAMRNLAMQISPTVGAKLKH